MELVCKRTIAVAISAGPFISSVRKRSRNAVPGGKFLFDTINRTMLATLFVVHFGETVLRLLPKGTHDPAMFIPPKRLREMLAICGFSNITMFGFGPRGLNSKFDVTFGRMPMLSVMYIGHAVLTAP